MSGSTRGSGGSDRDASVGAVVIDRQSVASGAMMSVAAAGAAQGLLRFLSDEEREVLRGLVAAEMEDDEIIAIRARNALPLIAKLIQEAGHEER